MSAAARNIQSQQEVYEDSLENGSPRISRKSVLRKPSSGAAPRVSNPKDSARRVLSRGHSASRSVKVGSNKIEDVFMNHFDKRPSDYAEIIDAVRHAATRGEPATCKEVTALKDSFVLVLGEIGTLKDKCIVVEERYKDATITASQELQQSMNVLFQLQQKIATLQDSSANMAKLSDELKYVQVIEKNELFCAHIYVDDVVYRRMTKNRLASADKERRKYKAESESKDKVIEEQAAQIKEMSTMLGGTSEELAQRNIDAKRANALWEDLSLAKNKIKDLKAENGRLMTRTKELEGLLKEEGGGDVVALHQRLQVAAAEKQDLQAEASRLGDALASTQNEYERLRDAVSSGGGGDNIAAVQIEKELRLQAEQRAEHERSEREAAEREWAGMSAQVVAEVDESRRRVDELSSQIRDAENRLAESRAETRRAQIMLSELNGTAASSYDVKVLACVKGGSSSGAKVKGAYVRLSSDGVSLKLSLPSSSPVEGEAATALVRKLFYDKVLHSGEEECRQYLAEAVQGLVLGSLHGEDTAVMVYGGSSDKRALTFGDDLGQGGLISEAIGCFAQQMQSMTGEWDVQVETSFVKIFEEEIAVRVRGTRG